MSDTHLKTCSAVIIERSPALQQPLIQASTWPRASETSPAETFLTCAKAVAPMPSRRVELHSTSPQNSFLCQDARYPFQHLTPPRPVRTSFAGLGTSVHWRGPGLSLFRMNPAAKCDIQDFLLGACAAQDKEHSEVSQPTGTKTIYIVEADSAGESQEALCEPTNSETLKGICNFPVEGHHADQPSQLVEHPVTMLDDMPQWLSRSQGVKEEETSLAGYEFDIDSDSDEREDLDTPSPPPPHIPTLESISEVDEDIESNDGFVNVIDDEPPMYCRNPHSADHPHCHGRIVDHQFGYNAMDAELDFQERFVLTHGSVHSVSRYRDWQYLKWECGQSTVHGRSSLRVEVQVDDDQNLEDENDQNYELEVEDDQSPGDRLVCLIEEKYGPLTRHGLLSTVPARSETQCSEECIFKIEKFLHAEPQDDLWLTNGTFINENEERVSEPSMVFVGLGDDAEPTPPVTPSSNYTTPSMTEEALLKILNTPHDEFIEHCVQRHQARRQQAVSVRQPRSDATFVVVDNTTRAFEEVDKVATEGPLSPSDTTDNAAESTESPVEAAASLACPSGFSPQATLSECDSHPASVLSTRSSRDSITAEVSFSSERTSVTTKSSNESLKSDRQRLIDTLDVQVKSHGVFCKVDSDEKRIASMPILSLSTSDICDKATDVSALVHDSSLKYTIATSSESTCTEIATQNHLTRVVEVQTLLPSATEQAAAMSTYASTNDCINVSTPSAEREQHTFDDVRYDLPKQQPSSPVLDDAQRSNTRQRWSSKMKCAVKKGVHAMSNATKQGARRAVHSSKKLGKTVRCIVPVARSARNPYETVLLN
ncbi:hypothetical protein C7974DRAFT_380330 [Boeremia exigua]|uniref:uncharacterized protein n=1 Tax=Boeremia exigua TaxID=749465 RepID=UPI001E8ED2AA|nr:uncharacterized protein C7974DRAFT_380330 [Boeremia exigua]KAH6613930.1 hypothetical protein C7974DRAFT_380330 [Boeremia exigua]